MLLIFIQQLKKKNCLDDGILFAANSRMGYQSYCIENIFKIQFL